LETTGYRHESGTRQNCLALRAPTLDLRLEITKRRKFEIQRIHLSHKIISSSFAALQTKMAQQCKQMGVGTRKGFAYRSGKLVLLANGSNRYEVDSHTLDFESDQTIYSFKVLSTLTFLFFF
jgi:hypothetical protein